MIMSDKIPPTHEPTGLKTLFFGTPRLAQVVLEKLINSHHKPQVVVTASDTKSGRGQKLQPSPVKQTALKNRIKVLQPKSLSDPNLKFDLAILVAYGKIISKEILEIPKFGFINIHPSILPKYRGPSPIQSAILAGEEKTGVTIILIDKKIDHGPILAQKEITISRDDTNLTLIEKLGNLGADLLTQVLPKYLSHLRGEKSLHLEGVLKDTEIYLPPKPQDHTKATITKYINKEDGLIDLSNPPDRQTLDRMIRAYHPWPNVWTKWNGKMLKFLPEGKIQPEGKHPMSITEFKNGYPQFYEQISQLFAKQGSPES